MAAAAGTAALQGSSRRQLQGWSACLGGLHAYVAFGGRPSVGRAVDDRASSKGLRAAINGSGRVQCLVYLGKGQASPHLLSVH